MPDPSTEPDAAPAPAASPEAEALFDAGLNCLGAGDWEGAIEHLRASLALCPAHRDATHALIRALDQAGRSSEALAATQALIAAEPDDVLARTSLSMIYQRMGLIPEAEKAALDAKLLDWKRQLRVGAPASGADLA